MSVIKKQTIIGTAYAYLGIIVGTITQAFIIPNYLTTEENGLLALLMSWGLILSSAASLGFNSAGNKYYSRFNSKHDNAYLIAGFVYTSLGLTICFLIFFSFKDYLIDSKIGSTNLFESYYLLLIPLVVSSTIFNLFDNYAKNNYDTVTGNFLNQFLMRFLMLISIVMYILEVVNLHQFLILWTVFMCLPAVFMAIKAKSFPKFSIQPLSLSGNIAFSGAFKTFAGFNVLTFVSHSLVGRLDTLLVYNYLGIELTGIYNTSLLFGSVMTISYTINMKASSAIVINALDNNEIEKVERIFKNSSITQSILGSFLLILVWLNIHDLFSFIKPEYALGIPVMIIVGFAKLFDLMSGINSLILGYSSHFKKDAMIIFSFIFIVLLLNHLLIPPYGLIGAGISVLIATVYYNLMRNYFIWKKLKIHPYSLKLVGIFILGTVCFLIGKTLPDFTTNSWSPVYNILYKSTLIGSIYMIGIYFFKFSSDINDVIEGSLKKLWNQ